tara:strand:- start:252 stop:365 length:114 start_codon:yes stop_codon:yes gene_type:complete
MKVITTNAVPANRQHKTKYPKANKEGNIKRVGAKAKE